MPPQISTSPMVSHTFRYASDSTGYASTLSVADFLLGAGGICTTANSTIRAFFSAMRLRAIEIWSPPASQGGNVSCYVEWSTEGYSGAPFSRNTYFDSTTVSTAYPAHLLAKPPRTVTAGNWLQWQSGFNPTICSISVPPGSIVDVHITLSFAADLELTPTASIATGSAGYTYYLALDGPTTNHLVPVALGTTH